MKVLIPFNDWSKERLKTKTKLATTRTKRYGKIGDNFDVTLKDKIHTFEILAVFRTTLYYVAKDLYHIEGAESPLEFRKVWEGIHPMNGWQPDKEVYVHLFRLLEIN